MFLHRFLGSSEHHAFVSSNRIHTAVIITIGDFLVWGHNAQFVACSLIFHENGVLLCHKSVHGTFLSIQHHPFILHSIPSTCFISLSGRSSAFAVCMEVCICTPNYSITLYPFFLFFFFVSLSHSLIQSFTYHSIYNLMWTNSMQVFYTQLTRANQTKQNIYYTVFIL